MSQSATERFHKLGREALAARFEHARIGKEVGFGAGRFTAGEIVHARFPAKQRAYIHKNVEDLIFAASYFDAIGGSFLELAPFRKQPRRLGRVSIKAQHKVTQYFQVLVPARLSVLSGLVRRGRLTKYHPLRSCRRSE